ncbi:hypothetical protein CK203_037523 [Vitis vinifera]|uniref:Uncharacterized protein n=1 Tax=Vitis vinifera TaxID=29760 RepID=A0A438HM51_VITVI|nr:hypothetical protein CK203_037523 [Vitis vinifera]
MLCGHQYNPFHDNSLNHTINHNALNHAIHYNTLNYNTLNHFTLHWDTFYWGICGINSGVGPSGAGINTDISHGGFMLQNACMFSFFITLWFSGLMLLWG